MPEPNSLADEHPIAKAYRVWSHTCPFVSRSTMVTMMVAYVLSWPLQKIEWALGNTPFYTVMKFEVYRLLTSVFVGGGFMTVIFGMMSLNRVCPTLERSLGSTGLLHLMVTLTLVTNLLFVLVCYSLVLLGKREAVYYSAHGMWNLIIALIAIDCKASPDVPRRFFILPFDIPANYYPFFLCAMFGLMRRSWIDLCCGVAVGYYYSTGQLDFLKPSRSRVAGWESGCLSNFVNRSGYINTGAAVGMAAFAVPINNPSDHPSNQHGEDGGGGGLGSFFSGGGDDGQGGGGSGFGANNVIKRGGGGATTGRDSFAGSGQTLGGGRGSSGGGGGGGSLLSGGSSQTQHDPETARLARLAALEGRGVRGGMQDEGRGGRGDEAAQPLLEVSDADVMALEEMGFSAAEASEALQYTKGDVQAAATYLAA